MEKTNNIGRVYRFKDGKYYKLVENEQPLCSGCVLHGKSCVDVADYRGHHGWLCTHNLDSDGISINCKFIASTREEYEEYLKKERGGECGTGMKEFNLEEAKAGKPVCTRDGRKARIICYDVKNKFSIVAAVTSKDGYESIYQYPKDGKYDTEISNLDLMMKPEKHVGWINVYLGEFNSSMRRFDYIYPTKGEALKNVYATDKACRVTTTKIEWEE